MVDARDALKPGAPQIWPEAPGNIAVDWAGPHAEPDANAAEVDRLFASAKYVARMAEMNQRLVVASMEPRGATASYDARDRQLSVAHLLAGRRRHARERDGHHELAEGKDPRHHRRCRRRVRAQDLGLSGIYRAPRRRQEDRPADPLDVGPLRSLPHRQSGPRHLFRGRACARREGQDPGAAHPQYRQYGRLYRRGRRQYSVLQFHALPARHVRHQAHRHVDQMRLHQHDPDRALSRRRPAGSQLRAGAPDGRGRRACPASIR